jgi:hypothetical protein
MSLRLQMDKLRLFGLHPIQICVPWRGDMPNAGVGLNVPK